jgi:hypothetical protein
MSACTYCFPDLFSAETPHPTSDASSGAADWPPDFQQGFGLALAELYLPKGAQLPTQPEHPNIFLV